MNPLSAWAMLVGSLKGPAALPTPLVVGIPDPDSHGEAGTRPSFV
jgi:hypothetical protein